MTTPDPHAASNGNAAANTSAVPAPTYLSAAWWQQHWQEIDKRIYECVGIWVGQWWPPQLDAMTQVVGEVFGEERHRQREAIAKIKDRVLALETTHSLEERFNRLANEAKLGSDIPQGEILAKIKGLQRQIDDLKRVADLDARFCQLVERVGELEKTHSLEASFTKLANEAKRGSELSQSELLARIEALQRQLDELNNVAAQPGPQGPPGKLPCVREYAAEHVHYEADVVTHDGGLWQALCDTVHAPPHDDWICLARSGRDAITPVVRGTFDAYTKYKKLDIVALDGAAFIAKRDNPGVCPGDGWQMISRQGRQGRRGESIMGRRGEKGEKGEPGATVVSWQLDRERYCISPLMSDGKVGPVMELRPMFEQFLAEVAS